MTAFSPKAILGMYILSLFSITVISAQQNQSDFWSRVRLGGGFGLGFGNNTFNLQVAPSGIYQANDHFATGVGLQLNYSKFGDDTFLAYGASFMNFYNPVRPIQLSAELEQWRVNLSSDGVTGVAVDDNYWLTALFLGIGYTNGNVTFGIRYDVLYDDERSIYVDPLMPFIRVYF
ncbi:alpha-ketoglutarate decarboxylase [Allomuricauda sp. SCSIO 65647]|uniref:alpha-ketoglutarate decarboxylase n=1 Tax=Allomuricauda sp. SCSIO 65647 TaxID=2908843 RepID=UPI001F1D0A54|nr:alpha-ketoglutarate decarboxylase [Muricauda sp. SCSIO 65647]UJH68450.1 alpha-ketoglutarate decarboxylase [Muricauda sp. SCSIO 65647]